MMSAAKDITKNSIPGPDDITRTELDNGIIVLARANFNSPSVMVKLQNVAVDLVGEVGFILML